MSGMYEIELSKATEVLIRETCKLQEGETLARRDDDLAVCGVQLSGKNFQKGGLSCAVGSDQAVAVALGELNVNIFEQSFFSDS